MADVVIASLVEGGKASGGPPLGPALGPLGVNINGIVAEINKKTKAFEGIKIPVKVIVNPGTKEFRIEVGSPTTSALIMKELGITSGAKTKEETVGNLTLEQVKKIATAKEASMYGNTLADTGQAGTRYMQEHGSNLRGEAPMRIKKISAGEVKV